MNCNLFIVAAALLLFAETTGAAHLNKEKIYQKVWCNNVGGVTEYVLDDGARVDCLTDEYVIEFDFAAEWAESVGQALYYAEMTGRRPGVVLIMEHANDQRFLARLQRVFARYGLTVWTMTPEALQ